MTTTTAHTIKNPVLVAFDFDGTITTKDSLKDFIRFATGYGGMLKGLMLTLPWLAGWAFKMQSRGAVKARFIHATLGSISRDALQQLAQNYAQQQLPGIVRADMLRRVRAHLNAGHTVLLVSASPSVYLKVWARMVGVHAVLSTELDYQDGIFTGQFATPNCWGPEKVARLCQWAGTEDFQLQYAYGDSRGDYEMLGKAQTTWLRGRDTVLPLLGQ